MDIALFRDLPLALQGDIFELEDKVSDVAGHVSTILGAGTTGALIAGAALLPAAAVAAPVLLAGAAVATGIGTVAHVVSQVNGSDKRARVQVLRLYVDRERIHSEAKVELARLQTEQKLAAGENEKQIKLKTISLDEKKLELEMKQLAVGQSEKEIKLKQLSVEEKKIQLKIKREEKKMLKMHMKMMNPELEVSDAEESSNDDQ